MVEVGRSGFGFDDGAPLYSTLIMCSGRIIIAMTS